ncbi:MAG: isoleucine--tRNA ligase [Candidatus Pacebacteria bacterium]|nr:isoleucine--tRNA ligase [Candidatus Paceibacterota bacterium]
MNKENNSFEEKVLSFWEKSNIFEKSVDKPAPMGDYVFYDGPPFATGTPHYGHLVATVMKDAVPRFWTMKGYRVERQWGWDCHGLPIENIVEKEMGIGSKKEILDIGVEKFNLSCQSRVLEFTDEWKKVIKALGRWVDMENSYKTMDKEYMESIWWVFKQLWDKDLIYKSYRSMHVCPRCETTLSQSEVSEGYRDIKDLSAVAKFKIKNTENEYILAWTTTPWTLIGNVALAVGEDIEYVKVKQNEAIYILAKDRLEEIMKENDYEIIANISGLDLIGLEYEPLFPYYKNQDNLENKENGWKIYSAKFVTIEEGTGVVHIAPAFGEDDLNLGKEYNLPFIQHVDMSGHFKEEVTDFASLMVKPQVDHMATDVEIIRYLAHNNLLFSKEKYEHSYPYCWRCDTPLLNYATSSYFVKVEEIKDKLLEQAKEINWSPEHLKIGRFGKWLEGARDWSISRQRFWASAIPLWQCDSCQEEKVIGSVKELEELSGKAVPDLHNHVIDKLTFKCEKCDGSMKRIEDVLDCWFESASMPYAQMHYPYENKEKFESTFPAQFIAEGVDQTRTWFYYLHIISVALMDKPAFKNVIANGIVLAEDGKKMSKKLKNYPDPMLVLDKYGADSLRYYLLSAPVMLADNMNFSESGVLEAKRKTVMILNNVFNFYSLYEDKNLKTIDSDDFLDVWMISRLNEVGKETTKAMENYNLPKATKPLTLLIDDLSTWYLRRSRDRLKGTSMEAKQKTLSTLRYLFEKISLLMAPFTPFIAEELWQNITGYDFKDSNKSVHLEVWPEFDDIDSLSLERMQIIREIVELGLAKRDETNLKVRQPLASITIFSDKDLTLNEAEKELLKDELNVKEVLVEKADKVKALRVALDTNLSEDLILEGIKRDLVRLINNLRKESSLTISDTVNVYLHSDSEKIQKAVAIFSQEIKAEVLAKELTFLQKDGLLAEKNVKINDEALFLGLEQIN